MSKNLFISCQKATELVEKKLLNMATKKELIQLWFHKKMCSICLTYEKESALLAKALSRLGKKCPESHLDEKVKSKIVQGIQEKV